MAKENKFRALSDRLRLYLASVETLPLLVVLGICVGLLAGGVIILFRLTIEFSQASFLPRGQTESYESLSAATRLLVAALGGLSVGLVFQAVAEGTRRVGVVHVMERLAYHQRHLPLKNAFMQFIGAAFSIISGQSVGREGPGVHLGAASGSLLGQWLTLPNNSIRTLVACGVTAAIAASFNTPISGVIFAMEVVMMEYTITGFAPVILAAVSATVLTQFVYGSAPAFLVPSLNLGSLSELPYVFIIGLMMGVVAFSFTFFLQTFTRWGGKLAYWQRTTIAGLAVGLCALPVPEIMGIGYDTVNQALLGQLSIWTLILILIAKLFATTFGLGFGLPGGLIGPTLVIGSVGGGVVGLIVELIFPGEVGSQGFYAMLGMGAMMGATLRAPLAALMAMLELTANPHIILPGMLAVIVAEMTNSYLFKGESVFLAMIKAQGLDYRNDPITQSLRRISVASVMDRSFVAANKVLSVQQAKDILKPKPMWVLIEDEDKPKSLLRAADLVRYLDDVKENTINLMEIPGQRYDMIAINLQATLQEAKETLDKQGGEVLYVWRTAAPNISRVYGILTRQAIESNYR